MKQFSISLGKFFGIPISIHWTFWILILWIVISNAMQGQGRSETIWYILFVFSIFGCVVLHELGHALAARRYGIGTEKITILPIGGVASLQKIPEDPKQELVVAVAGPLVNVVIAGILFAFLSATGKMGVNMEEFTSITAGNFLMALFTVNILLVVFNLIPAFPMDGGRVLRALLAFRMDRVKATEWAVNVGKFFAILFVFWGFSNNPFLIFIAIFIFIGAQGELSYVRSEHFMSGYTVQDIMERDYILLRPTHSLAQAVGLLLNGQNHQFLVGSAEGVLGVLNRDGIIRGLTQFGEQAPVEKVMQKDIPWLTPDASLQEASELMLKRGFTLLPVGASGQLLGVLSQENVNEFLMVQSAKQNQNSRIESIPYEEMP